MSENLLQSVAVCCREMQSDAEWCRVSQCVAKCRRVMQSVVECCRVLQCDAMHKIMRQASCCERV